MCDDEDMETVVPVRHPEWEKLRAFLDSKKEVIERLGEHCIYAFGGYVFLIKEDTPENREEYQPIYEEHGDLILQPELSAILKVDAPLLFCPMSWHEAGDYTCLSDLQSELEAANDMVDRYVFIIEVGEPKLFVA